MKFIKMLFVVGLSVNGCSMTPAEPDNASGVTLAIPVVKGFQQRPETSKFVLGTQVHNVLDQDYSRTVGSFGVASIHKKTGYFLAVPNNDSPVRQRPPIAQIGDLHNARALEYFALLGMPMEQVTRVVSQATMSITVEPGQDPMNAKQTLVSYTTSIRRIIEGIDVSESFAAVTINIDGDVVSEYVYWPDVRKSTVAEAHNFENTLNGSLQGYRSKLPEGWRSNGSVMIHHVFAIADQVVPDTVVYTALPDTASGIPRHFDVTGGEVKLAWESREPLNKNHRSLVGIIDQPTVPTVK